MSKPEHTRPFSQIDAKAGAPYGCRGGQAATVLKWDAKSPDYPLVGTYISENEEYAESWSGDGRHNTDIEASRLDLVMLPLGFIDGKPVFVGDEIEDRFHGGEWRTVKACAHERDFDGARWPAPAKQYPETAMTKDQLNHVFNACGQPRTSLQRVADAALRHAIDSGQLPTKEAYDQCNAQLAAAEKLLESLGYQYKGNGEWQAPVKMCASSSGGALAIAQYVRGAILNALAEKEMSSNSSTASVHLAAVGDLVRHFDLTRLLAGTAAPAPSQPAGAAKGHDEEVGKREWAIAKAVLDACRDKFTEKPHEWIANMTAYGRLSNIILAPIIASVKETA